MKKIGLSLKQKKILKKIIFTISCTAFVFSAVKITDRIIDFYKTKTINYKLSKIHEEIDNTKSSNIDNTTQENNFYYTRDNIKELEWTNMYNMFMPEGMDDLRVSESENLQYLFQSDAEDRDEALKRINDAIIERNRIEEENKVQEIKKEIQRLKKINNDIKGWIRIDNTQLSNPIVQTIDNSFYLEHDVTKSENSYGTIFIDSSNDVSSPKKLQGQNIILYGHHMKDGTMFGALKKFRDNEVFKSNDIIKLDLFPNSYKFQVFGVYLVDQDFDYRNTKLGTQKDISSLLSRLSSKCLNYHDVSINPNDTVLTLSTCEYDFTDARLVIMAKLVAQ